jgi:hypothetical protein
MVETIDIKENISELKEIADDLRFVGEIVVGGYIDNKVQGKVIKDMSKALLLITTIINRLEGNTTTLLKNEACKLGITNHDKNKGVELVNLSKKEEKTTTASVNFSKVFRKLVEGVIPNPQQVLVLLSYYIKTKEIKKQVCDYDDGYISLYVGNQPERSENGGDNFLLEDYVMRVSLSSGEIDNNPKISKKKNEM